MSQQLKNAKPTSRLPGRVYTLLVVALASILVWLPLARPSVSRWVVRAVVQHPGIKAPATAEQATRKMVQSTAEEAKLLRGRESTSTQIKSLQSKLTVRTQPAKKEQSEQTTIEFRSARPDEARVFVEKLAYGLASEASSDRNQVKSLEVTPVKSVSKARLVTLLICSFMVGLTTIFFPRPRSQGKDSDLDALEMVSDATGLPIIGTVLPASPIKTKRKSSNLPLRFTAFTAELIVASAFLLMLYGAATNPEFLQHLMRSPLGAYAQSVRSAGAGLELVLNK